MYNNATLALCYRHTAWFIIITFAVVSSYVSTSSTIVHRRPRMHLHKSVKGDGYVFPKDSADGWFDTESVGMPVVYRYTDEMGERWKMWYHGRDTNFNKDNEIVDIGTGRIGAAYSTDGINWTRDPGQMAANSILSVNEEQWWGFDTAHIGLGDISLAKSDRIRTDGGVYFMYYFGGDYSDVNVEEQYGLSQAPMGGNKGIKMRIGVAISQDGMNWSRLEGENADNSVLDCGKTGEWDELFVGWPSVLNFKTKEFRMYYHSMNPHTKKYSIGMASSGDGLKWIKRNPSGKPVFSGGSEGDWDSRGAGRRCILEVKDELIMFYEGVDEKGVHSIGIATSRNGMDWRREESNKPVFEPSLEPEAWDSGGVTSPRVVDLGDGVFWMFYVGYSKEPGGPGRIGIAQTTNYNFKEWTRVKTS